ncbi:Syntaxin binding protein [Entamoeba marina]
MADLTYICKKKLLGELWAMLPQGWKVFIADSKALRIISSFCGMDDLLNADILDVNKLELKREPFMCPALYLIEPTAASVDIICNEFSNLAEPQYSCAYIACINAIDPDLRKRLTSIKRVEQVVTFPLDFHTIEKRVFTLNDPNGFSTLHSYDTELNENDPKGSKETDEEKTARKEKEKEAKENSIRQIGKSLASFCYCLGINPAIRYINRPDSELTQGIVESLRSGHDDILQSIEVGSYNPDRRKAKKLNILIMDRTSDLVTPLLTEFTYQAMCIDVLPILFNNITIQNKGQEKVVNLEEDDSFWNDIRHKHIANASPYVVSGFNSFMASHKGIVGKKGAADMEQMGEMMKQLPEYMDLMTKFSNHMALITMCFDKMKELNLDSIAAIEQIWLRV